MAKYLLGSAWLVLTIYINGVNARSWQSIKLLYDIALHDNAGRAYLEFVKQQLQNDSSSPIAPTDNRSNTTLAPSPSPSDGPTNAPTLSSSDFPSSAPTNEPINMPSPIRTNKPSDRPNGEPSTPPTLDPNPEITGPNVGDQGYFNYDVSTTSEFGPNQWGDVSLPQNFYWDEFGSQGHGPWKDTLRDIDFYKNECARGKKHQSPIDVFETVSGCDETHEIREHNGDHPLSDVAVDKRIEPNKLRLAFPRRPCADIEDVRCQVPHPPWADFPNGFRGIADVIHIDFKIPSEHWLRGEIFDGELQVYHLHAKNGRVVALSTVIRATEQGHNQHFQLALDAFQMQYDKNQAACNINQSSVSNGTDSTILNATVDTIAVTNAVHSAIARNKTHNRRDLHNIPGAWSPYHPDIMSTIYFYRYEGSITEPPCSEFVTWFVNDSPMNISVVQLEQWRMIQFTNIDPQTCTRTSVHSRLGGVARPILRPQPPDRKVSRCTIADYGPDPFRTNDY